MSLTNWSLDEVAKRCKEETEKFRQRIQHDTKYCYELFRRALYLDNDDANDAFGYVMKTYKQMVRKWVYRTSYFAQVDEDADFFVSGAFARLHEQLHGPRFLNFETLPAVLKYLSACTFSVVQDYWRKLFPLIYIDSEDYFEDDYYILIDDFSLDETVAARALWDYIESLLPDEDTRRLARYCYQQNLKPTKIMELESTWGDQRGISIARQRIRRILSKDKQLTEWLGFTGDDDDPPDDDDFE